MNRFRAKMPSPGLVVATVALVVALGGTSYAAFKVGTKNIKNGAVTTKKLKNGAVTTNKIGNGAVTASKINTAGLTVPNATSATALARVDYESQTVTLNSSSTTGSSGIAACPTGLNVVGGGAHVSNESNDFVNDSYPVGRTGWQATGFQGSGSGDTMIVYAICTAATKTTP